MTDDNLVTDMMVASLPGGSGPKSAARSEPFLHHLRYSAQAYVITQYRDPGKRTPMVVFESIVPRFADNETELTAIYQGIDHTCDQCEEGMNLALNRLRDHTGDTVAVVEIRYREVWP